MSNNLFYKSLAAISTAGILVIAGMQASTALKKDNNADDQLAKTLIEIKNARKDALNEVNVASKNALREVKAARKAALNALKKITGGKEDDFYLVYRAYEVGGVVPMHSMDACEIAGATLKSNGRFGYIDAIKYECVQAQ